MENLELNSTTASGGHPDTEKTILEIESLAEAEREKNWLENAIRMDVLTADSSDLRDLVNALFDELLKIVFVSNIERYRESLKTVLLNLHVNMTAS